MDSVFNLFPNLPAELRIKIWKTSLTPRLIEEKCWRPHERGAKLVNCPDIPLLQASYEISVEEWKALGFDEKERHEILYNPKIDILTYDSLRSFDPAWTPTQERPGWNQEDSLIPSAVNHNLVKKVQVTTVVFNDPTCRVHYDFEVMFISAEGFAARNMVFTMFPFKQLDQFIVQDVDCKEPHELDSPEKRDKWKSILNEMFKREKARTPDHNFKIPEILIRTGSKTENKCAQCVRIQKYIDYLDEQDRIDDFYENCEPGEVFHEELWNPYEDYSINE